MLSRRRFLQLSALGLIGATGKSVAHLVGDGLDLKTEEIPINVPDLPSEFKDYRIGFISDLHLGVYVPHEWIERAVKQVMASSIDLLVFGGDYISVEDCLKGADNTYARNTSFFKSPACKLAEHIFNTVSDLMSRASAPDGVFAVFGNHDRHVHFSSRMKALQQNKINPLVNNCAEIKRGRRVLRLIGVDDMRYSRAVLPRIPILKPDNEVRVLVSHNPDFHSRALRASALQFDLGLAGHTHGGQIKLPLLGAVDYNIQDPTFGEGLRKYGRTSVYTTRGIGVVRLPWRFNCPAEVSILTLQGA